MEIIGLTIIIAFIIGYASGRKLRPDAEKTINTHMIIIADQRAEIEGHKEEEQRLTNHLTDAEEKIDAHLKAITDLQARVKWLADPFSNVSPERIDELKTMPYHDEYLQTPEWKARSKRMKARFNQRCQVCNNKSGTKWYKDPAENKCLVSHHRTYANVGKEKPIDLTSLCNECHDLIHKHYDGTTGFGKP